MVMVMVMVIDIDCVIIVVIDIVILIVIVIVTVVGSCSFAPFFNVFQPKNKKTNRASLEMTSIVMYMMCFSPSCTTHPH